MNVTFKGKPVTLVGELPKTGDKIAVKGTDMNFEPYTLRTRTKKTVLSFFPSIDTTVCDQQTRKIIEMAKEYPDVNFVSMSLDLPTAIKHWCGANGIDNVTIISDYKKRTFAKRYGLLIDELKLMARGLMALDEKGRLLYLQVCEETASLPDFEAIKPYLK